MENKWALFPVLPLRFLGRRVTSSSRLGPPIIDSHEAHYCFGGRTSPLSPSPIRNDPEAGLGTWAALAPSTLLLVPRPNISSSTACLHHLSKKARVYNMDRDGLHACWRLSVTQQNLPRLPPIAACSDASFYVCGCFFFLVGLEVREREGRS